MRRHISVRGVVQGVGFRPFVFNLARRYGLAGWVCNTSGDVQIEIEGEAGQVAAFEQALLDEAPPLARIEGIAILDIAPAGGDGHFEIRESLPETGRYQLVSPDIATCELCRQEIFDPADRRYRYPFTNCTNCGPRFTIISDIPYDRPNTTMRAFQMCSQCQAEYDDPLDRRFHAQPNACPVCGPQLALVPYHPSLTPTRGEGNTDPISATAHLLLEGRILAIKGLGGFHLACDATNEAAVQTLRQRKHRPHKPLAVMIREVETVRQYCEVTPAEEELLRSPQAPIVLLRWREGTDIAPSVAPGQRYLGVMLPYTPLHHLLLQDAGRPLVMTSGNLSEEPIARDNDEAWQRLHGIADAFLLHNRDIYARYDDSVFIVEEGAPRPIRRARGYAPFPVRLAMPVPQVLACGAEMKSTFCLTRDEYAFISQHIGDLENLETLEHYQNTIDLYQRLFRIQPALVAYDLHPDYLATQFALQLDLPKVGVQHHHAHIVACMAENGVAEPAIGVALDGTGYGTDGTIWGGEFLLARYEGFERMGHLQTVPVPGGAAAIQRPYRMAYAYLRTLLGEVPEGLAFLASVPAEELAVMDRQMERGINAPLTSSCGRLFDAVSALLGIRGIANYEAQAAIELEMAAAGCLGTYPYQIRERDGRLVVELGDLFAALVAAVRAGDPVPLIAGRFHNTVVAFVVDMCERLRQATGNNTVAISGGVLQNRRLFKHLGRALGEAGFKVLTHRQVPCNDGGISLGQAVIASYRKVA